MAELASLGQIFTFYSYKGGTGRSMALANVACLLAGRNTDNGNVLMIDWDLEAPGLHRFFERHLKRGDDLKLENQRGLIDLFIDINENINKLSENEDMTSNFFDELHIDDYITRTNINNLSLMTAGKSDNLYPNRVNTFNWENLFNANPGLISGFASYLSKKYKHVLIDSRTGFTDISSICTALMPEKLIVVFTPNLQSLTGVLELIENVTSYRRNSDDLRPLSVFPLPSRIENAEDELRSAWRFGADERGIVGYQPQFEAVIKKVYDIQDNDLTNYFNDIQIQYVPRYAYGEEIAVLSDRSEERLSLARSYENFTQRLVEFDGPWVIPPINVAAQERSIFDVGSDGVASIQALKSKDRKLRVFISHGLVDTPIVRVLYRRLLAEDWIDPWIEEENLLPGQDRELLISETLKSTDVVLLCFSKESLDRGDRLQRDINSIVSLGNEKPDSSIFIVPIRLDECEIPQSLRSRQYVNFFPSEVEIEQAYSLLIKSMSRKYDLISGNARAYWAPSSKIKVVDDLADLTFGGFSFVKIPKGKFIMGSRASNNFSGDDEHPQRPYEIPYNYWITCFPVSNEQFSEYTVSTRHLDALPKDWKKKLDQPITNVSWYEVVEYPKWLNKIFKKEIPKGLVFRLPTEAEWERASRGDLGAEWPWGNENLDDFLNRGRQELLLRLNKKNQFDEQMYSNRLAEYFANVSKPKPSGVGNDPEKSALDLIKMRLDELRRSTELADVGTFSPVTDSPHDIADMMGSIWEWTQSLYWPYPYDMDDGREDLEASGERVVKGCFMSRSERFSVRSAKRGHASPDRKEPYLGFRIIVGPPVS